jgi:hypothetical protein
MAFSAPLSPSRFGSAQQLESDWHAPRSRRGGYPALSSKGLLRNLRATTGGASGKPGGEHLVIRLTKPGELGRSLLGRRDCGRQPRLGRTCRGNLRLRLGQCLTQSLQLRSYKRKRRRCHQRKWHRGSLSQAADAIAQTSVALYRRVPQTTISVGSFKKSHKRWQYGHESGGIFGPYPQSRPENKLRRLQTLPPCDRLPTTRTAIAAAVYYVVPANR